MNLKGKVAVVTGGSRDIGRATVVRLAQAGANVVFTYSPNADQKKVAETVKLAETAGAKVVAVSCDVTKSGDIASLVESSRKAFGGPIGILVNLAGGLVARKKMDEMDEAFWDQVIDLNLKSAFLVTKAALPHMREGGAIVNVSSQAGRDGGGGGAIAYATAKGGMMTFTRGLAKELGARKIRVNAVCPGLINTDFHNTFTKPDIRAKVVSGTPVGREGESVDVANLIAYLASDESAFVNGACIDINGGTLFS